MSDDNTPKDYIDGMLEINGMKIGFGIPDDMRHFYLVRSKRIARDRLKETSTNQQNHKPLTDCDD